MGKLREHQNTSHRLDGGVPVDSFADGIADALLQVMQEGVDGVVAEFSIGHWPEGIPQWQ